MRDLGRLSSQKLDCKQFLSGQVPTRIHADAPQLLDEQARVPGLAPWLQEAPIAAQVHARYLRDLRRQLELASDERDFRIEHEVPALQAGRKAALSNLQKAHRAAAAAEDNGRSIVLQRAVRRAQALIEQDAQALARLPSDAGIRALDSGSAGDIDVCSDDAASVASVDQAVLDWHDLEDDVRSAVQQHARDEAEAEAEAPFEPIQQSDGDFPVASAEPSSAAAGVPAVGTSANAPAESAPALFQAASQPSDGCAVDTSCSQPVADGSRVQTTVDSSCSQDVVVASVTLGQHHAPLAQAGEHSCDLISDSRQQLQVVETVAEAKQRKFRTTELVILTEVAVTARLTGEDFRALALDRQLTTPVLDLVSIMVQVQPNACNSVACMCDGTSCLCSSITAILQCTYSRTQLQRPK